MLKHNTKNKQINVLFISGFISRRQLYTIYNTGYYENKTMFGNFIPYLFVNKLRHERERYYIEFADKPPFHNDYGLDYAAFDLDLGFEYFNGDSSDMSDNESLVDSEESDFDEFDIINILLGIS